MLKSRDSLPGKVRVISGTGSNTGGSLDCNRVVRCERVGVSRVGLDVSLRFGVGLFWLALCMPSLVFVAIIVMVVGS